MNAYCVLTQSFNSKLVQLEVSSTPLTSVPTLLMFQFQTGSIRRYGLSSRFSALAKFQFQTGSIRSHRHLKGGKASRMFQFQTGSIRRPEPEPEQMDILVPSFNSKLVRLEGIQMAYIVYSERFQFQTGSIRRVR